MRNTTNSRGGTSDVSGNELPPLMLLGLAQLIVIGAIAFGLS